MKTLQKSAFVLFLLISSLAAFGALNPGLAATSTDDGMILSDGASADLSSGDTVHVAAGDTVDLSITLPVGSITLNVTPSENLELTITIETSNPNGSLPDFTHSVGTYLVVDTNNTEASVDATITLPFDPINLPTDVDLEDLELRYYNETSGEWEAVVSVSDTTNNVVSANVSHFSSWTATGTEKDHVPDGSSYNVSENKPVQLDPNSTVELVTPSGIAVNVSVNDSVEITFDEFDANPAASFPDNVISVTDVYVSIELNDTSVEINATINVPYDATNLRDGVDPADVVLSFYNVTAGEWQDVPSAVDTAVEMISANTTHFSTWTATVDYVDYATNNSVVDVTLGKPVALGANMTVDLVTPSGIIVNVTVNESVEITFDEFDTNPNASLPDGITSISKFVSIETNETTDLNATVTLPYQASQLPDDADESALNLQFYNATAEEWQSVASLVDANADTISANTTHFSTWSVTTDQIPPVAEPGTPFEIEYGKPVAVEGNTTVELVTPSGVSVSVSVGESVEITIDQSSTNPVGAIPTDKISINLYLTIETNETADLNATISVPIPTDLPDNLNTSSLQMAFYNETSSEWETVPAWSENGMLHANTTHFSIWTVFGSETVEDTDTTEDSSDTTEDTPPATDDRFLPFTGYLLASIVLLAIPVLRRQKY